VLPSISESYYALEKRKKNSGVLFSLTLIAFGFPLIYFLAECQQDKLLMIIAVMMIMLVGVAAPYRIDKVMWYHIVGAAGGITLGIISLVIEYNAWYSAILFALFTLFMFIKKPKNYTYKMELAAFFVIIIHIIIEGVTL
jgi:hypothetical protein